MSPASLSWGGCQRGVHPSVWVPRRGESVGGGGEVRRGAQDATGECETHIDHQDEGLRHPLGPKANSAPRRRRRHTDREEQVVILLGGHGEAEGELMVVGDEGRLAVDCGDGRREEVCRRQSCAGSSWGCRGRGLGGRSALGARRGRGRHSLPARSAAPASAVPILLAVVHIVSVSSVAPLDAILVLEGRVSMAAGCT